MAEQIYWNNEPFALLVDGEGGRYIVPPVVFDADEKVIEGAEVLQAIAESGVSVEMPVLRNRTPADLAAIDQRLKEISDKLGVPIGPPGVE